MTIYHTSLDVEKDRYKMTIQFPAQFTVRPANDGDVAAYIALTSAIEVDKYHEELPHNDDELAQELKDAARSLIVEHDDSFVALLLLFDQSLHTRFSADGSIHPQWQGHGIEGAFIYQAEEWAQELAQKAEQFGQIKLHFGIARPNTLMRQQLLDQGFELARTFWRMRIDLTEPPQAPVVPDGFIIRTIEVGKDEPQVHATVEEAFRDHWEFPESTFEEFQKQYLGKGFDPSLWFVAVADDTITGSIISNAQTGDIWINKVAVRRSWRKRGLAMALLRTAFTTYYARGIHRIELGVDADSPTNAQKLYIEAGMHAVMEWDNYRKIILMNQPVSSGITSASANQ